MRATVYPIIATTIATCLVVIAGCETLQQKKPEYFPIQKAVEEASAAVTDYTTSDAGKTSGFGLRSAEFTFKVTKKVSGEVGASFGLIFNASGSIEGQHITTVKVRYKKPSAKLLLVHPAPKSALGKAIDETVRSTPKEMNGVPRDEIAVEEEFGIEKKIGVGGQAVFSLVTIGPKASASNNTVQSVSLVFAK